MAVPHTTVLSLLGKEVSFSVLLDEEIKIFFPQGIHINGCVQEVIIALNGNHQIWLMTNFMNYHVLTYFLKFTR